MVATKSRNRSDHLVKVVQFHPEVVAGRSDLAPKCTVEVIIESIIGDVVAPEVCDKTRVDFLFLITILPLVLLEVKYGLHWPAHETTQQ